MSQIFSYRVRAGELNSGSLLKTPSEKPLYYMDFADAMPSGVTISTASTGAVNDANAFATGYAVGTTAISGTLISQTLLTCGSSGTSDAQNGWRGKITTTATLSNGEILVWNTFVLVQAGDTYDPT